MPDSILVDVWKIIETIYPHRARFSIGIDKLTTNIQEKNKDTIELKRGRIIGIIERILMYYFVIEGNLTSIGFILAAKSFTRFKELNDKDFAEYVLIGTLLSAFLAIATGILVKKALL